MSTPSDVVFATVSCVLTGDATSQGCLVAAEHGGVAAGAIASADASALEQIGEAIGREARHGRVPVAQRAALQGWFDLATHAANEARIARAGTQCVAAIAREGQNGGDPVLDDVEDAWRHDRAATRAHDALVRFFTWLPDAGSLHSDAEATALWVLADRIDAAVQSRPEVREEAAEGIDATLTELSSLGSAVVADARPVIVHAEPSRGSTEVAAHAGADAEPQALRDAHARVVARLRELTPRLETVALREAVERASAVAPRSP